MSGEVPPPFPGDPGNMPQRQPESGNGNRLEKPRVKSKKRLKKWAVRGTLGVLAAGALGGAFVGAVKVVDGTLPWDNHGKPQTSETQNTQKQKPQGKSETAQPTTPEAHKAAIIKLLQQRGVDTSDNTPTGISSLAQHIMIPVKKNRQAPPASSVGTIEQDFGTDFGISKAKTAQEAAKALIGSGNFVDVTKAINPADLMYLPDGVIVIQSNNKGFRVSISLGLNPKYEKRTFLANAGGYQDMRDVIKSKSKKIAYVISPIAVKKVENKPTTKKNENAVVITHGPRDNRIVALTFDAGIQSGNVKPNYNQEVINTLKKAKVPATLFVTAELAQKNQTATQALAKNPLFEIGDLSYDNSAFTNNCNNLPALPDDTSKTQDVKESIKILKQTTGKNMTFFRFPGTKCYDANATRIVTRQGLQIVGADVAFGDASNIKTQDIVYTVKSNVKNGSIIRMSFDGGPKAATTTKAVGEIILDLKNAGYKFATVSQLVKTG